MPFMEWTGKFSVGIPSIDEQHKKLFGIINKLYEAMYKGKAGSILNEVFNELVSYTKEHFAYEELLFKAHAYPQTEQHKKEHAALVTSVSSLKSKFESGAITAPLDTSAFLRDWLNNHILVSDKAYGSFLSEKGVT
jgi:hemerythrin-like metal-binding protein